MAGRVERKATRGDVRAVRGLLSFIAFGLDGRADDDGVGRGLLHVLHLLLLLVGFLSNLLFFLLLGLGGEGQGSVARQD